MESDQLIVGLILSIFGIVNAIQPKILLTFQIWTQKVIMGAQYIPSRRTFIAIRVFGVIIMVLGVLVLTGTLR